jgi:hypothetical protein
MSTFLVLAGFGLIVLAPCLVALNATIGEEHSPIHDLAVSCRRFLRKIL